MKKIYAFFLCCLAAQTILAQSTSEKINATIKEGTIMLNQTKVTPAWEVDNAVAALNGKKRSRLGANITHTYDKYGIVLFETIEDKVLSGVISEIQFFFSPGEVNAITPSALFKGNLMVEQLKVTADLTPGVMKSKLKNYKLTNSYMEHSFRLAYKGLYIYFLYNTDETKLIKVSIGVNTRKEENE